MAYSNTVSFQAPTDFQAEAEANKRQQAIAQALLMKAQERPIDSGEMVGKIYVPSAITQKLAQALQGPMAQYELNKSEQRAKEIANRQRNVYGQEIAKYGEILGGTPEKTYQPLTPNDDEGNPMPAATQAARPGDRSQALAFALGAQNPLLQQMGVQQLAKQNEPFTLKPGEARFVGGQQQVALPDKPTNHVVNGQIVQVQGNQATTLGAPIPPQANPWENLVVPGPDGKPMVNAPLVGAKTQIAGAGAAKNMTMVNAYTPASEAAQKDFIDKVSKRQDALQSAPVMLKNIDEAKALIPKASTFMGPGGQSLLEGAKFLNNRLGLGVSTEGIKNAEELRTRLFVQVMENLKKMDAQPSQYQQKVMQDAFGTLGTDPNALPQILDAFGDIIRGKVQIHNQEVRDAEKRGVKFPYNPMIDMREKSSGGLPDASAIDAELARRRGDQ